MTSIMRYFSRESEPAVQPGKPPEPLLLVDNMEKGWNKFKKNFDEYVESLNIQDQIQKGSLLVSYLGYEGKNVYEVFQLKPEEKYNYDIITKQFEEYCTPKLDDKKELLRKRQSFHNAKQWKYRQTVEGYLSYLRNLAEQCEFGPKKLREKFVRDKLIDSTNSNFDEKYKDFSMRRDRLKVGDVIKELKEIELRKNITDQNPASPTDRNGFVSVRENSTATDRNTVTSETPVSPVFEEQVRIIRQHCIQWCWRKVERIVTQNLLGYIITGITLVLGGIGIGIWNQPAENDRNRNRRY